MENFGCRAEFGCLFPSEFSQVLKVPSATGMFSLHEDTEHLHFAPPCKSLQLLKRVHDGGKCMT